MADGVVRGAWPVVRWAMADKKKPARLCRP